MVSQLDGKVGKPCGRCCMLPGSPRRLWLVSASLYGVCTVLPTWTVHEYPLFRRPTTAEKGCGRVFFSDPQHPKRPKRRAQTWILVQEHKTVGEAWEGTFGTPHAEYLSIEHQVAILSASAFGKIT